MADPNWKGLFEWSIKQQEGQRQPGQDRQVSEEDRRWFMEAMEAHSQDITKRLKDIKSSLDTRDDSDEQVAEKLKLLEDLTEVVEHIDYARDLTTIGGLQTLLGLLDSSHPPLRASAAEVVATCVQNNPPVQQYFLEGGALPRLLQLAEDQDAACRRKALLALSCLTRHSNPAMDAFQQQGGLELLLKAARDEDPRQRRKALQLLRELVRQRPLDIRDAVRQGLIPVMTDALRSEDADVREAALALLALLMQHPAIVQLAQKDEGLQQQMREVERRLKGLDIDDLDAEREQLALTEHILDKLTQPSTTEQPSAAAKHPNQATSAAAASSEGNSGEAKAAEAKTGNGQGEARSGNAQSQQNGSSHNDKPMLLVGPP